MGDIEYLTTDGGITVPLHVYEPEGPAKALFLYLPALGVRARFYRRLAEGLAAEGIAVALMEQRGHGDSPYRPNRETDFGYRDYLEEDIPTVRTYLAGRFPDLQLYMGGHSLGCHMSNITAALYPEGLRGLIHMACVFPHVGLYSGWAAFRLRILLGIMIPVSRVLGYYPGSKLGFGATEFIQGMRDWKEWAAKGTYDFGAYVGLEDKMKNFKGPFLSIEVEDDSFASPAATAKPRDVMAGATLTTKYITSKEQGSHIGHFDWARNPTGIVHSIADWIKENEA